MAKERLEKIKGEIPHPFREVVNELKAIKTQLEEISQKLQIAVPPAAPIVVRPGMPPIIKIPAIQLPKEEFMKIYVEALEKYDPLKYADDLYVQTIDLSTDRSTADTIEELTKFKKAIAITIFKNSGTFDLYINEKNIDHKLTFAALTFPQTFLLDWFRFKTIYIGNAAQAAGTEAVLIAWKRLS